MPYAESAGAKLYYETTGTGTPIVFVHEFAGDHRSWEPQMRHFARRYHCTAYNARGYPPSDVPDQVEAYSQAIAADDIAAVISQLGLKAAHVVGLSMGSFAALHFALRHPEMARSVVVAGGGYGALAEVQQQFRREALAMADRTEAEGMATVAPNYGSGPYRAAYRRKDPRGFDEFLSQLAEHSTLGAVLTMRGVQCRRPSFPELGDQLEALTVPMLIVAGDEDEPSLDPSLYLKRIVRSAALCVLPTSGHAMNLEEPDLFNRVVENFITTVDAGRWHVRQAGAPDKIL